MTSRISNRRFADVLSLHLFLLTELLVFETYAQSSLDNLLVSNLCDGVYNYDQNNASLKWPLASESSLIVPQYPQIGCHTRLMSILCTTCMCNDLPMKITFQIQTMGSQTTRRVLFSRVSNPQPGWYLLDLTMLGYINGDVTIVYDKGNYSCDSTGRVITALNTQLGSDFTGSKNSTAGSDEDTSRNSSDEPRDVRSCTKTTRPSATSAVTNMTTSISATTGTNGTTALTGTTGTSVHSVTIAKDTSATSMVVATSTYTPTTTTKTIAQWTTTLASKATLTNVTISAMTDTSTAEKRTTVRNDTVQGPPATVRGASPVTQMTVTTSSSTDVVLRYTCSFRIINLSFSSLMSDINSLQYANLYLRIYPIMNISFQNALRSYFLSIGQVSFSNGSVVVTSDFNMTTSLNETMKNDLDSQLLANFARYGLTLDPNSFTYKDISSCCAGLSSVDNAIMYALVSSLFAIFVIVIVVVIILICRKRGRCGGKCSSPSSRSSSESEGSNRGVVEEFYQARIPGLNRTPTRRVWVGQTSMTHQGDVHSDFQADYKALSLHRNMNPNAEQSIPQFLRSASYQSAGTDSNNSGPPVEPEHANWRRTDHQFKYNLNSKATIARQKPGLFAKKKPIEMTGYFKRQTSSTPISEISNSRTGYVVGNYGGMDQYDYFVSGGPQSTPAVNDSRLGDSRQMGPGGRPAVSKFKQSSLKRRSDFDNSFLPTIPLFHQVPNAISHGGEQRHVHSRETNRRRNSLSDSGGMSSSGNSNGSFEDADDSPERFDRRNPSNVYDQRLRSPSGRQPYYGYDGNDVVPCADNQPDLLSMLYRIRAAPGRISYNADPPQANYDVLHRQSVPTPLNNAQKKKAIRQ